jgi:hypothetical protein
MLNRHDYKPGEFVGKSGGWDDTKLTHTFHSLSAFKMMTVVFHRPMAIDT